MAKKGIQHLLCKIHGGRGLVLVEAPLAGPHLAGVYCRLCNPRRWINWCSERHAWELSRTYGEGLDVERLPEKSATSISPPAPSPQPATSPTAPSNSESQQQAAKPNPSPMPRPQRNYLPSMAPPTRARSGPRRWKHWLYSATKYFKRLRGD